MRPKIKGWSSAKKAEIVLALLKGAKQLVDICRENDLKQSEVEKWKEDFLSGGEQRLKIKTVGKVEEEIKRSFYLEVKSEMEGEGNAISIKKLCFYFGVARSSFYYRVRKRRSKPLDKSL